MTVYAALMLIFFGITVPTALYGIAAIALMSTYLLDRNAKSHPDTTASNP